MPNPVVIDNIGNSGVPMQIDCPNNLELSGVISGGGGLNKTSGQMLILSGTADNTFSGVTTIAAGTLQLAKTGALAGSTLNYNNQGGSLGFGTLSAATLGGLSGSQSLALPAGFALSVGANHQSTTYSGTLSDGGLGGSLTKVGSGTLTFSAAPTYTGATNINGGTLALNADIGNSTAVNVNTTATLAIVGYGTRNVPGNLTFNGAGNFQVTSGANGTGGATVGGNLGVNGTPTAVIVGDG